MPRPQGGRGLARLVVAGIMLLLSAGAALAASEVEPNNRVERATLILPGERVSAGIAVRNDKDWYAFTLPAAGTVTLVAGQQSSAGNGLTFALFTAAGAAVQSAEAGGFEGRLFTRELPAGDYRLLVSNRTGTEGNYWLRLEVAAAAPAQPLTTVRQETPALPGWWFVLPAYAGDDTPAIGYRADSLAAAWHDTALPAGLAVPGGPGGPALLLLTRPAGGPVFVDLRDTRGVLAVRWRMVADDSSAAGAVRLRPEARAVNPSLAGGLLPGDYALRVSAGNRVLAAADGWTLRLRHPAGGLVADTGAVPAAE